MENKDEQTLDSQNIVKIRFSPEEEKDCYVNLRGQLIKLLYMIEAEQRNEGNAELFLYGLVYEIHSANSLCRNKLTKIIVKIHGLYDNYKYREMTHAEIKRQIMESKGILDHLITGCDNSEKK